MALRKTVRVERDALMDLESLLRLLGSKEQPYTFENAYLRELARNAASGLNRSRYTRPSRMEAKLRRRARSVKWAAQNTWRKMRYWREIRTLRRHAREAFEHIRPS